MIRISEKIILAGLIAIALVAAGQTSTPPVVPAPSPPPAAAPAPPPPPAAFSYETVRERARAMAAKEFKPDLTPELPEELKKLSYDGYQGIHFRPEESLWPNQRLQFSIQFFH